jgi:hypothetical protein
LKKKIRDFNQVKCINDEFDIVKDKEIKNRWRKYFNKLVNKEREKNHDWVGRFIWWYQQVICSNSGVWGERKFKKDEKG